MSDVKSLYEEDLLAWSKQQAEALRSVARDGSNQALDWENLAEEIDSLGKAQRHALKSQVQRVVEHLLKLEYSRATDPRGGWIDSINNARTEIGLVLEDSPSLKAEVATAIEAALKRAPHIVILAFEDYGEIDPATAARIRAATYTEEQILGDWLPSKPQE